MSDKFEKKLFRMAADEKIILPAELELKIETELSKLPGHRRKFKMNFRKSLVLAAALIMLCSITAAATAGALRQRLEDMNRRKLEEYFVQIYTSRLPADNYNRPYTESERERMETLRALYEKQGRFPEKDITMIDKAEDYSGKGVAFLKDTSTFFFPEAEMDDEQLLQIIDFYFKRDYSLQKINEMIESGETAILEEALSSKQPDAITGEAVLQSKAALNPGQELTIPYTGDLPLLYMASGRDCIFLTGWNKIHTMEIGSSTSALFFDKFNYDTRVTALYQDKTGDIYLGLLQRKESGWQSALWVLDEKGELVKKIDLEPYLAEAHLTIGGESGNSIIRQMAVDEKGYIYIKGIGFQKEEGSPQTSLILDKEGKLVSAVDFEEYEPHISGGLGIGKDGRAYMMLFDKNRQMGIASIDPATGKLKDIYMGIVPDDTIVFDMIAPGFDSDFIFWGYSGIYTYNLGDESAELVMPAYEFPCDVEAVPVCVLPDGRIVLASCSEYNHYQTAEGADRYDRIPEKTCFYYLSGIGN